MNMKTLHQLVIPQAGTSDATTVGGYEFTNPKVNGRSNNKNAWFPYYAGFSADFVRSAIELMAIPKNGLILDPWNGAGTTTQVAYELGYPTIGLDLNPAMAYVAAARLVDRSLPEAIANTSVAILNAYNNRTDDCPRTPTEPLHRWFSPVSAQYVRSLQRSILECVQARGNGLANCAPKAIFALFYLVLFRAMRELVQRFRSSNPTWLRRPKTSRHRIRPSRSMVADAFDRHATTILKAIQAESGPGRHTLIDVEQAYFGVGTSVAIPLRDNCATAVISSPPYCTRIDYAIDTAIELAVLGISIEESQNRFRDCMMGTSTIRIKELQPCKHWGALCCNFLSRVYDHASKASRSYYYPNHVQYFGDLFQSLKEITRCTGLGGHCVLVIQDSYYKDIHNPVAQIAQQMLESLGWALHCLQPFPVLRSMAGLNGRSRAHRSHSVTSESVLWMRLTQK